MSGDEEEEAGVVVLLFLTWERRPLVLNLLFAVFVEIDGDAADIDGDAAALVDIDGDAAAVDADAIPVDIDDAALDETDAAAADADAADDCARPRRLNILRRAPSLRVALGVVKFMILAHPFEFGLVDTVMCVSVGVVELGVLSRVNLLTKDMIIFWAVA